MFRVHRKIEGHRKIDKGEERWKERQIKYTFTIMWARTTRAGSDTRGVYYGYEFCAAVFPGAAYRGGGPLTAFSLIKAQITLRNCNTQIHTHAHVHIKIQGGGKGFFLNKYSNYICRRAGGSLCPQ